MLPTCIKYMKLLYFSLLIGLFLGMYIESPKTYVALASETKEPEVIKQTAEEIALEALINSQPNPEVARYICDKFGKSECRVAIAVARAESGLRCDAVGINTNRTTDFGPFQINSVHIGRFTLSEIANCEGNVNTAYKIYQEQGWNPWVAYLNGSYRKFL